MVPSCDCTEPHVRRRVVLTGGPGAGKTALLELVRQLVCPHVRILGESAGIIFGGGFPRSDDPPRREASQRAIYHVQRELEIIGDLDDPAVVLCDRGTVDGLAYWPGRSEEFWTSVASDQQTELARYDAVIHLRVPDAKHGYNHSNPLRIESARVAHEIDERLVAAWEGHPRRTLVDPSRTFLEKAEHALSALRAELPACCTVAAFPGM